MIASISRRTLGRLFGSVAILGVVFWLVPFEDVFLSLTDVKLGYFAAGILLSMVGATIEANQLWILLRHLGLPTRLRTIIEAKLVSRFYGQFVASEVTGSAVKLYRLAKPTQQWGEVGAAMVFVRLLNTLALVLMGLVFVLIEQPEGAGRWVALALLVASVLLIGLHILMAKAWIARLPSIRLPGRLGTKLSTKLQTHGLRATESYRLFGRLGWLTLFQGVVRHTIGLASFACLALSLDIHVSLLTLGWIRAVMQVVLMLPLAFSGIGMREATLALLLQDYGVTAGSAVALGFLLFIGKVMKNSIGGLIEARSLLMRRDTQGGGAS